MSRILIYSDVHGNLPAFEVMLKHVGKCDAYISLGDLVNYGPWSNECVDLACSLPNSILLIGNHEEAFLQGHYPGNNQLVKLFFETTYPYFTRFKEIETFKKEHTINNFTFVHTVDNQYIYPDTNLSLDKNYIIGHSHHQFVYKQGGFILYNAGSVGQNRKFINVINYLILDQDSSVISLAGLKYDIDPFINALVESKYPQECVDYYLNKERN